MKHLKTFQSYSINEDWLDNIREEKIKKWQAVNIQPGDFVHISGEYGDVWHEVDKSLDTYITIYKPVNAKQSEVKTELVSLANVTNHSKSLPANTRCFSLKTGFYSPNTGNLDQIPKFYRRNMDIDSIVGEN